MNFNIQKFERNLQKHKVNKADKNKPSETSGTVYIIGKIWDRESISNINFNEFTLDDVLYAYQAMEELPLSQDEDEDEAFHLDPKNPFAVNRGIQDAVYGLCNFKYKVYEINEEDDFI